jgi:DNA invertase Pin-like site-specific DNA recombinase
MTTERESAPCIGYLRVSTERQAGELHTSLADQETAIRALAERLGLEVGAWYRDEGASGATVDQRPAFRALIEACERDRRTLRAPGHVLVLNDSRFGRFPDPDEAAAVRFRLKQAGWLVRFCESDDVQDPMFRPVIRALGSAQASEYRRAIQRNARRGARGTAELGFWGREAPFGYRRRVVQPTGAERVLERGQLKAPNEKVALTPHEEEARVVLWAFEAYASGEHSLSSLAQALALRVPWRRWSRRTAQALLLNPAYRGDVLGGRRSAERVERLLPPVGPEPEWYGREDAHPAIVSRTLFQRAQDRLARNRRRGGAAHTEYLLSGLLVCPYCGHAFVGGGGGRSRTRNPERTHRRFYRDRGGTLGTCPGPIGTVMRHLVDDAAVATLTRTIASPTVRRRMASALDGLLEARADTGAEPEAWLRTRRSKLEQKRDRLVRAVTDGTILPHEAAGELARLRAEIERATAELETARFRGRAPAVRSEDRDRLLRVALDFPAQAKRLTGQALRGLIEPWLHSATFDKVTRVLTLAVRPLPLASAFPAFTLPGPDEHGEGRPLIRRIPLIQPGYPHRQAPLPRRVAGGEP